MPPTPTTEVSLALNINVLKVRRPAIDVGRSEVASEMILRSYLANRVKGHVIL